MIQGFITASALISICSFLAITPVVGAELPPVNANVPERFIDEQGFRMLLVHGGSFYMGPKVPREADQIPRHLVAVSSFYLSAFVVSKGQFRVFAKETGIEGKFPELDPQATGRDHLWAYDAAPGEAFPVYHIDWYTANAYAAWLSQKEHRHYRLPTESEWEYAAHAGTDGWYWWGDDPDPQLAIDRERNFTITAYAGTYVPGTTPCNPWGFYDILGNVAEWTLDWHAWQYPAGPLKDPKGPSSGDGKVLRGGSFEWTFANCYYRGVEEPSHGKGGIRLVCDITPDLAIPAQVKSDSHLDLSPFNNARKIRSIEISLPSNVALKMVRIHSGSYTMGSPTTELGHGQLEGPLTHVFISHDYYLSIYPVTQRQYRALTGQNPSHFKDDEAPVEEVSCNDAVNFCDLLTRQQRSIGALGMNECYRLPTDPEWEFACRAGTQTAYFFGDSPAELDRFAWFDRTDGTHRVGQKLPNQWGLFDIYGNVKEWCWGSASPYPGGNQTDPLRMPGREFATHPEMFSYGLATARGGAWNFAAVACRSAMRDGYYRKENFIGFRIARCSTEIQILQSTPAH